MLERVPVFALHCLERLDIEVRLGLQNVRNEWFSTCFLGIDLDQLTAAIRKAMNGDGIAIAKVEVERGTKLSSRAFDLGAIAESW